MSVMSTRWGVAQLAVREALVLEATGSSPVSPSNLTVFFDRIGHVVCEPYTVGNLHAMARAIGLKRHWYERAPYPHYDLPKKIRTLAAIDVIHKLRAGGARVIEVRPREIITIAKRGMRTPGWNADPRERPAPRWRCGLCYFTNEAEAEACGLCKSARAV